jgi:hypothetical protein
MLHQEVDCIRILVDCFKTDEMWLKGHFLLVFYLLDYLLFAGSLVFSDYF